MQKEKNHDLLQTQVHTCLGVVRPNQATGSHSSTGEARKVHFFFPLFFSNERALAHVFSTGVRCVCTCMCSLPPTPPPPPPPLPLPFFFCFLFMSPRAGAGGPRGGLAPDRGSVGAGPGGAPGGQGELGSPRWGVRWWAGEAATPGPGPLGSLRGGGRPVGFEPPSLRLPLRGGRCVTFIPESSAAGRSLPSALTLLQG